MQMILCKIYANDVNAGFEHVNTIDYSLDLKYFYD